MRLITVPEACERLSIDKHTAYRLIHNGTLPATRVSQGRNRYLVDEQVVEKLATQDFYELPEREAAAGAVRLLTTDEVAAILRCAVETVRRLAARGALPAVRNPGRNSHWRFREDDILKYLNNEGDAEPESA